MSTGFVHRAVQRANRIHLIASILGLLLTLGVLAGTWRYLSNVFAGPQTITPSELTAITNPDAPARYYVTVTGDEIIDAGYQEVSRSRRSGSERVTANYEMMLVGDRVVLVSSPTLHTAPTVTGYLRTPESKEATQIIADIKREYPELNSALLPYVLDAGDFNTAAYIQLAVLGVIGLLCAYGLFRFVQRSSDPTKSPIMRRLADFGPLEQMRSELDAEMAAGAQQVGPVQLTPNWLVQSKGAQFNAVRLSDLAWAYKTVTQHRTYFIPTGKTFAAQFYDRHGKGFTIAGKEPVVEQVLAATVQRAPWAFAGYSEELENAWKNQRPAVLQALDERRTQAQQMG